MMMRAMRLVSMMALKTFITKLKRRLGLMPKDWTPGSDDYNRMMAANTARNEESGVSNSNWAPGALRRLRTKQRWTSLKDHWRSWWHN
jgi:hypothetical protein